MKKKTKRIMLAVCSCLCVFGFGMATVALNTTNTAVEASASATATFVGVDENQNNKVWPTMASWQATYLNFEGGTFTGANGGATSGSITYTRSGEGSETNFVVWSAAGTGQLQLLWETYNSFADGSTIHIEEGTVVDGLTLPEVNLIVENGVWVNVDESSTPTPDPEPTTVTFVDVDANQNNVQWGTGAFIGVFLTFSEDFTAHSDLVSTITYTPVGGEETPFGFTWANYGGLGSANQLQLLINGLTPIADGAVLHIPEGTVVGGLTLPEVNLIVENGKWVKVAPTPDPEPTTATFVDVDANQNNKAWPSSGDWLATYLQFSGGTFTGANAGVVSGKIYYTNADGTGENAFTVWSENGTGNLWLLVQTFDAIPDGSKLYIEEGTVVDGLTLPEVNLTVVNGLWQKEGTETPEPPVLTEVEFVEFNASYNNGTYPWGDGLYGANVLYFDKPLYGEAMDSTSVINMGDLATNLTINGKTAQELDVKVTFAVLSTDGKNGLEFYFLKESMPKFSEEVSQIVLEIKEGTKFLNNRLPALKFYLNAEEKWQTEEYTYVPPQEVTFAEVSADFNNTQNPWRDEYYLSAFVFSDVLSIKAVGDGAGVIGEKLELNDVKASELGFLFSTTENSTTMNVQYPKASLPVLSETVTQVRLELTEAVVFGDVIIQPFTLYLNGLGKWQTTEYTYVAPTEVEFIEVNGDFNNTQNPWRDEYYLSAFVFGENLSSAGVSDGTGLIAEKLTLNGVAVSELGFLISTTENSTTMNVQYPKASLPVLSETVTQVRLELTEAVVFGDVEIQPFTLYLNGLGKWQTTEYTYVAPTEVEFVEFDTNYNNGTYPFGDGAYTANVLYFDVPLYAEAMDTALVEIISSELATNMKINGVTAKDLGVAITFTVLSETGRNGLEFYFLKENMPKFTSDGDQIILEIIAETKFLNNILPTLKFYLNGYGEWQTEEYTYEYVEPEDVTFVGVSFSYNNAQNPWRDDYYLSAFEFNNILSQKAVGDGAGLIAEKLTLNGVAVSELGFLLSTTEYSSTMNVQYPKASLDSLIGTARQIRLELTEEVAFGDVIIQPFRLYWDKDHWTLIDETDKTAPEINYGGTTEIVTSAGKPFVIDVSAFDNEDDAACEIYYTWSAGALDGQGNLVEGNHTCTITAIDKAGNAQTLVLTLNVGARDTEKPVITAPDTLTVYVGATPEIEYSAADNLDGAIDCQVSWSDGALDADGKLVLGTHTMTLTATDLTGNTETKAVTVVVIAVPSEDVPSVDDDTDSSTPPAEDPPAETPDDNGQSDDTTESKGCKSSLEVSSIAIFCVALAVVAIVRFVKKKKA